MISRTNIIVRYAETDKDELVHYSVYPIWYDTARMEAIRKVGAIFSKLEKNGIEMPMVELNCKYSIPAEYGDVLTVNVGISKVTNARIVFYYEIYKAGVEKPISVGNTAHSWIGKDKKPINLKKDYPELFEKVGKLVGI